MHRIEHYRHDCGRYQHDHCAGDNRREYTPKQREPRGQHELEQRRYDDEARHCGGPALNKSGNADRYKGP